MELRQLRYFLAVADCGNFTRGAERVGVSQPSLSVQIQALEEELGSPLFDRLGRHIALTDAGRVLQQHAERVLRELEVAVQSVRELSGAEHGRLLVGTLSTVNSYLIPPLVCRFKERFPGVQLHVQARASGEIEEDLLGNRLDLGICLLPTASDRLVSSRLFTETLSLVVPPQIRLSGKRVRMRDLAKIPLVLLPNDYCLRKMIEQECWVIGVRPLVSVEMTSPEGILEAVRQGAGATVLPELYVRHHGARSGLRLIPLYDPVPRHAVGIVRVGNRHMGKAAQAFIDLCRSTLDAMLVGYDQQAAGKERVVAEVRA